MERAVRWAILSAVETEEPTLTTFVLLDWKDSGYCKWLQHPRTSNARSRPTLTKNNLNLRRLSDHWQSGQLYAKNPKWNVLLFTVANTKGLETYVSGTALVRGIEVASREIGGTPYSPTVPAAQRPPLVPFSLPVYPSKAYRQAAASVQTREWHTPRGMPARIWDPRPPLRYDPGSIIYTDGSAKETQEHGQRIGSGIFYPNLDVEISADPCGHKETNTITRAELVAILVALQITKDEQNITIATDSKTSMQTIQKQLSPPMMYRFSKHRL